MTPHMDSCSNSRVFSSVQKDDKMSKRQADPSAASSTAKQKPVRNFCAYAPHETKFKLPMKHSHEYSEQMANRLESKSGQRTKFACIA